MRWVLVILVGLLSATAWAQPSSAPTTRKLSKAVIVGLEGEINEYTEATIKSRISEARKLGADTVILRLYTPGGMVVPALDLSRFIKQQDDLHIIAFIHNYAYSAGALLALACDEIYMQPGSFLGDCAPIIPGEKLEGAERAKAESPLLAEFRDSAARHGYDPLLAQSMVQYSIVVHYVENADGLRRFVDPAEYEKLIKEGWKAVAGIRNPVDGPGELLTVNADEAGKLGLSKGEHPSVDALAQSLGLTTLAHLETTGGEHIIALLSSSAVRGMLGVVFMLALLTAIRSPGLGYPEAAAVGALALMVGVPMLTGYAQWYEILAIVLGVILLAVELFVIPGFGVTGFTGILLILMGLIMTFVPKEPVEIPGILPTLPGSIAALKQGTLIVVGGLGCSLFLWIWLQRYLPKMPYFNRLILATPGSEGIATFEVSAPLTVWPAVGSVGKAVTDLRPSGTARFRDDSINDDRNTDVVCDRGFVKAGAAIQVREVEGNRIVVRELS